MADLDRSEIDALVEKVYARLRSQGVGDAPATAPGASGRGVFPDVDQAVDAATRAFQQFGALGLERRKEIIANVRRRTTQHVRTLAAMAVEETGLGRVEDKVQKNLLVINKTPGPEILEPRTHTGDAGLCLTERAPYGVIGAITPTTNPTETVINNMISMLSGGNTVAFNVHPSAERCSHSCVSLINDAIVEAGGPENCVAAVARPTIQSAQALMRHKGLRLLTVTGGPAVVREAMNSGKKVIAAGPGNPPVVVDETADIEAAGKGIVAGASLDNNIVCIVEKEVFAVHSVADSLKAAMVRGGAVEIKGHQIRELERLVLKDGHANKEWVGKDAGKILAAIGVRALGDPRLVMCEVERTHPFVQEELLMPVMPVVRVKDVDEGIACAIQAEHGFGHTAVMWSRNVESLHRMARVVNTSIFVKNAPSYAGLGMGGEGYTSFTIASPTGEGLTTAVHFTRERRCTLAGYFRII
ncbi:aldehyde dehydrogenase EutE [Myxococcota bacterium]|nr:aldehyde dehydrogenase EutE [Myxococcota bacterium]